MNMFKLATSIATVMLLFSSPALGTPIIWDLQNVVFDDGGTASGSFVFDADSATYSSISITTTTGAVRTGAIYGIIDTFFPSFSDRLIAIATAPASGVPRLSLEFQGQLTNLGGTVGIWQGPPFASFENECADALCGVSGPVRGMLSGGSVTSVAAVPEPTTLALLSLGLAGLGFTRRRVKA